MSFKLEVENVVRGDDLLQFFVPFNHYWSNCISPEFIIRKATAFKLETLWCEKNGCSRYENKYIIFVSFRKLHPKDDSNHTMNISSIALGIKGKEFTSDDGTWHVLHEGKEQLSFAVSVTSMVTPSFAKLHEDTDFNDFEVRGEDGSVQVHKAVLAASSPVLRQMLSGAWRETKEGHVDVPGTSQLDLQHLKGYLYLHQLPDSGLEQLLLLSSYYIMPDLEQMCVNKLINTLTVENAGYLVEFAFKHKIQRLMLAVFEYAGDLVEFAAKHKIKSLILAVLGSTQGGVIKASDLVEQLLRGASVD